MQDTPDRPTRPQPPPPINWVAEIFRILLGLLSVLLALVVVGTCLGMAFVSYKMIDVLHDISKRDFSEASQRFDRYGVRFDAMTAAHCKVEHGEPKITKEGVTTYLWMVQPPGSDDRVIYRWKHDLSLNKIEPMTNAALLLDINLGYVKSSDAASFNFYNPGDKLAQALATQDFKQISPDQLQRIAGAGLPQGPVLPPKIAPDQARSRARAEPATPTDQPAAAAGDKPGQAGDATDVGGNQDNAGSDTDKGKDKDKDKDTPPPGDNDAVPVE